MRKYNIGDVVIVTKHDEIGVDHFAEIGFISKIEDERGEFRATVNGHGWTSDFYISDLKVIGLNLNSIENI